MGEICRKVSSSLLLRVDVESGLPQYHRIHYSDRYSDDKYEYRHVILPKPLLKLIPKQYFNEETGTLRLLSDAEWRGIGIQQSLGWVHYEVHSAYQCCTRLSSANHRPQHRSPMCSCSVESLDFNRQLQMPVRAGESDGLWMLPKPSNLSLWASDFLHSP